VSGVTVAIVGAAAVPLDAEALRRRVEPRVPRPERLDELCLASLGAALAALDDACLTPAAFRELCPALVLGTALGCAETDAAFYRDFLERGPTLLNPRRFAYTLPNVALGELAIALQSGGDELVVTAGRASGLVALGEAAALVAHEAEAALALAVDVDGPTLRAIYAGLGTRPVPVAAAFVLRRWTRGARAEIAGFGSDFDPDAADAWPAVDPLGAAGVAELLDALPKLDAPRRFEAACASGHRAHVEIAPVQPRPLRVEREGGAIDADVWFPPAWPVFRGHFPGDPIVPGAELVRLAVSLTGRALAGVPRFSFRRPVRPDAVARFQLRPEGDETAVEVTVEGETCAAGRVNLG
jgi:hypothetical protein